MNNKFKTIIFDLGAVLIDWNPRYVYKQIFVTDDAVEYFLKNICTTHWNEEQDAGRSFADGTQLLLQHYPEYTSEITAYYGRWREMLKGPIQPTVDMLKLLKDSNRYRLLALTNWAAESFPVALERFEFLQWFESILVSGEENMKKPEPAIFELLLDRYQVDRDSAIFIDDNIANVLAARGLGIETIHFTDSQSCKLQLEQLIGSVI